MSTVYTVQEGDCLSSIAFQYGFFPDTIWNDSANRGLKELRKDPNTLYPGDEVTIPDLRVTEQSQPDGKRHRFRRRGVPEKFRLRLDYAGCPRAHLEYTLDIDGRLIHGETDQDGMLEIDIPPDAVSGVLRIGDQEEYQFQFGTLPPASELEGLVRRLVNLGWLDDDQTEDDEAIRQATADFQRHAGLPATGQPDNATNQKLAEAHGR